MNGEGEDGGEASSGQLFFSSCSWVRSTKTPPARSGTTASQTAPCRCSILQSLVDAPSGIDTPTTAPSRSDSVNLFAPWPRGAALCTPARLPPGVSPPFRSIADICYKYIGIISDLLLHWSLNLTKLLYTITRFSLPIKSRILLLRNYFYKLTRRGILFSYICKYLLNI